MPTLSLELALRQYDDFLVYIHCQHQTILSAVKCFAEGTEWPCVMVGSAFEGCCLPRNLHRWEECATHFDFLVCLPTPKAGESTGNTLQYLQQNGRPHQVILKLSDPSIVFSDYILGASDSVVSNLRGCCHFLHECSDGFYLKKSFMETIEGKIKNSLGKVLAQKPGGMKMVARDSKENCTGPCASLRASFFKAINERLDMLPLDPDTWSGDAMTNAQMMWVNLTNWSTQFWPARTFNVYPAFQCEWPEDAKIMWLERDRFWPSEAIVQEIAQSYCYLLPLWNNSRNNHLANKEIMELQITFGTSEYLLFSETGPKERQCVVILKALIEKHSLNFQILSSFVMKTVLFWYLQSIPLSQRQGLGRGELLVRLLDNLICFLNEKNLRHFFIPSVNLLDSFDSVEISNALRDVKKVRRDLLDHLSELFQLEGSKRLNEDFVNKVLSFI